MDADKEGRLAMEKLSLKAWDELSKGWGRVGQKSLASNLGEICLEKDGWHISLHSEKERTGPFKTLLRALYRAQRKGR